MTTSADLQRVRDALEAAGSGWLFLYLGDSQIEYLAKVAQSIEDFIGRYKLQFQDTPDPYGLLQTNPLLGRAFFHADTLAASADMKVMVWRILQGCEIDRLEFGYEYGREPRLAVTLRTPSGANDPQPYVGQDPLDFRVLRHFTPTVVSGRYLILQGYYAASTNGT